MTFSVVREDGLSLWEEQFNDFITQGSGENLMDMYPEELRVAINKYLDKGPDFIKYGGTSHWFFPTLIGFSPEAQRVIVEETHKRGLVAETHATNPEGLRLTVEAGIDLIQHPAVLAGREISDDLVREIRERGTICSMLINTYTGVAWQKHLKDKEAAKKKLAEEREEAARVGLKKQINRKKTSAERRRELREFGHGTEMRRVNAKKLIDGGCIVTLGTDNAPGTGPEYLRAPKRIWQESGIGTIMAIEGLVELGMTASEAIVAATKNGALACKALDAVSGDGWYGCADSPKDEEARKCIGYVERNRERMRYPKFRAAGLCTSTGVVEAGCKVAIGTRCKRAGMHWTVAGVDAIIALRCCKLSGRFEDFWERRAQRRVA